MELKQNVSNPERIARAAFALMLVGAGIKKKGVIGVLLGFAAGDIMSSAISGYCPLCEVLGLHGASCCGTDSSCGCGCDDSAGEDSPDSCCC